MSTRMRPFHFCDMHGTFVPNRESRRRMSKIKAIAAVAPSEAAEAGEFDAQVAARICWHYFKEGQTQEEVAQRLGLTRKRVNQMIGFALESGLVKISIDGRFAPHLALEAR